MLVFFNIPFVTLYGFSLVAFLTWHCNIDDPMNYHEDAYDEVCYCMEEIGIYYYDIDMKFDTVTVDDIYYRYHFYQIYPG